MFYFGILFVQEKVDVLEVDYCFIFFVENELMRLNYIFFDENGVVVNYLFVEVMEREIGLLLWLLYGKCIIIEIEFYIVIKILVVGWNEDIESGDMDME